MKWTIALIADITLSIFLAFASYQFGMGALEGVLEGDITLIDVLLFVAAVLFAIRPVYLVYALVRKKNIYPW